MLVDFEGKKVTAERARYLLVKRNQATIKAVDTIVQTQSNKVLEVARNFSQPEMGGFLRTVIPGLVDTYGNVNMVAAMKYYDDQRALAKQTLGRSRDQAKRLAAKQLEAQIYVAKQAPIVLAEVAEPVVNWGMKSFVERGFDSMKRDIGNSLTRATASYNRDTILYNSALDPGATRVQRVAEPNACSFCVLMAFSSERYGAGLQVRTADYAIKFHDSCRCSIETLYAGDTPFRPPYYDKFEQAYYDAQQVETTDEQGNTFTYSTTRNDVVLPNLRKQLAK